MAEAKQDLLKEPRRSLLSPWSRFCFVCFWFPGRLLVAVPARSLVLPWLSGTRVQELIDWRQVIDMFQSMRFDYRGAIYSAQMLPARRMYQNITERPH